MPERFLTSVLPRHEVAELYRLMVIGIKDIAVVLTDPAGMITVWNKGAELIKGYSADEAIGQHLGFLYTDSDQAAGWPARNLAAAERDGVYSEERWRKRKDGELFWAHTSFTALRDPEAALLGFSSVTVDLTRHKQLEKCEKEKREIDLVLEAANSGTLKWSGGADIELSRHLRELLGYGNASAVLTLEDLLQHVQPEHRTHLRAQLELAGQDRAGGAFDTEVQLLSRDGRAMWFYIHASWRAGVDGQPSELVGVCVPIDAIKTAQQEREQLFQELDQERTRMANILDQLPSGLVLADIPSGRIVYQNREVVHQMGSSLLDLASYHDYSNYRFLDVRGRALDAADLPLARRLRNADAPPSTEELVYLRATGPPMHVAVTTGQVVDPDGVARLAVAIVHDITPMRQAELLAATEKERALVTLGAITDGVITVDLAGVVTSMNPAAEMLTGLALPHVHGRTLCEVIPYEEAEGPSMLRQAILRCVTERRVLKDLPAMTLQPDLGVRHVIEHAVAPVPLVGGDLLGAVLVLHDVTQTRALLRRLGHEAAHDALTDLVNRREFETRLARTIEHARGGEQHAAALLYLDLDQFKIVNDTCGHSAGDDLLRQLAQLYNSHVRERDTLARLGGDEFALIVEHCDLDHAVAVAHTILEATLSLRFVCNGRPFQVGVSIGVIAITAGTPSVEEALRSADHACYLAKERGRNRIYVQREDDRDTAERRSDMLWITRLSHAFQCNELQLYYQPIVPLHAPADVHHYEILLRLRDSSDHPISPGRFLPAAERYDIVTRIDRWVLQHTLAWLGDNPEHTRTLQMCSINLSRRSLGDASFRQYAADLIDRSSVPPEKLCFEITENGAIADMQGTTAFIRALSARGCRFSLDDFGTGMTSFAYLKELPVDYIKIDGSLIQTMGASDVDMEMVRFTNDISHRMGRQTIAEYVNSTAILDRLKDIGVDFAQGYLVGMPRPLIA
ncbi:MAG: EAL domain-containing protein [Gammaproteobacteria bacterium]